MNRITGSLPAKFAAVVLIAAAFLVLAGSGLGVGYLYFEGYYGEGCDSFYESQSCTDIAESRAWDAVWRYDGNPGDLSWLEWYGADRSNLSFEIVRRTDTDKVLARNYIPGAVGYRSEAEWDPYIIRYAVADPLVAEDVFFAHAEAFRILYPLRWTLIGTCAGGTLVFLALLAFLMSGAGRRRGTEGITLGPLHRIPLDLYAGVVALVVTGLGLVALDNRSFDHLPEFILGGVAALLAFLLLLSLLLTLSARVKAGGWWRNTVIFRVLRFCGRLVLAAGRHLPLVWKAAAGAAAVILTQFVLAAAVFASEGSAPFALLLFGFDLAVIVVVCRVSLNMQRLRKAAERLAAGETGSVAETAKLFGEFRRHGENLNRIRDGIHLAVEERMKSERLKTELITNVSHDIKTPLTSIVNYVDLMKKEGLEGRPAEYLEVLDRQSQRLRKLTDDLVEASKASTGNLPVEPVRTDLREVVTQAVGEYAERMEAARLEPVVSLPETGVFVMADGRLMWRVLDNLLGNALKYSLPGTRVYIDVREEDGEASLSVKNISSVPLNIDVSELMERFVRGDTARSTEGSGLGLNIARSLAELQGARFGLAVDGDLFKAVIRFSTVQ